MILERFRPCTRTDENSNTPYECNDCGKDCKVAYQIVFKAVMYNSEFRIVVYSGGQVADISKLMTPRQIKVNVNNLRKGIANLPLQVEPTVATLICFSSRGVVVADNYRDYCKY